MHAPDQATNFEPTDGVAVNTTFAPGAKAYKHVEPQLMPRGLEATVPRPVPTFVTFKVFPGAKVAVTDLAALIVTVQTPVPEHAPDQPTNLEPAAGLAVSVTLAPYAKTCEQAEPHEMPLGLDETAPDPVPALETFKLFGGGGPLLTTRFTGGPTFTVRCATAPAVGLCETTAPGGMVAE